MELKRPQSLSELETDDDRRKRAHEYMHKSIGELDRSHRVYLLQTFTVRSEGGADRTSVSPAPC